MHAHARMGWRRTNLVCGRAARSIIWRSCARNGRNVQGRPSLPRCRSFRSARRAGAADWQADRPITRGPCFGARPDNDLSIRRRRGWHSHSRVLCLSAIGRCVLQYGGRWLGCEMATVLAKARMPSDSTREVICSRLVAGRRSCGFGH